MKKLFITIALCTVASIIVGAAVVAQTKVTVFKTDGTQQEFSCNEFSELRFENENLVVYTDTRTYMGGYEILRSEIRKITFADLSSSIDDVKSDLSVKIYPNPTSYEFKIINYEFKENETVQIFDFTGRIIYNALSTVDNFINVSQLATGIYFVKIGNNSLKFIKI